MEEQERTRGVRGRNRSSLLFDEQIPQSIAKSGRSLAGVMLGLIVFIAYWLVAGPGGYALLKRRGWGRHAWVAFFGASLAFTALAWGGATALRPKRVEVTHLSYLDHVYGERIQRVRSWVSVLVPVYGNATVGLESDGSQEGAQRFQQAVAPWEPNSGFSAASRGSFPDARSYRIDARSPDSVTFPARATVKQLQLDWAGGMAWDSIRPATQGTDDPMDAVGFTTDGGRAVLEGSLLHGLPAALEDVEVIVFRGQIPVQPSTLQGRLLATGQAYEVGEWQPGAPLDLRAVTSQGTASLALVLDGLVAQRNAGGVRAASVDPEEQLKWLSLFNLFGPPDYLAGSGFNQPTLAQRSATHGLDMSRWSTRPCLIVIGMLRLDGEEESLPAPVWVETNGSPRVVHGNGTTIVRWVLPLPADPPRVGEPETEDAESGGA